MNSNKKQTILDYSCFIICLFLLSGYLNAQQRPTFGEDLAFLNQKIKPIILKTGENRQVLVSAEYQGRVMTSTSNGAKGDSYGWFNKRIISSDTVNKSICSLGSAGRIWFGPDQGPYSIFHEINTTTGKAEYAAPKDLNTLPFKVYKQTQTSVELGNTLHLENLKGFEFDIDVKREINILSQKNIEDNLDIDLGKKVKFVGFKTKTSMKNVGDKDWSKTTGLLSLWDLGCFYPTPKTTVVIPLKGDAKEATIYFTEIDDTRIAIKNNVIFYKADANYLNKIGTLPEHTLPYFGSYSPELNLLTIVQFSFDGDRDYVNSHSVNIQEQYRGDVINVFNDGKIGNIGPFGPFYELETSSPAKALKIGERIQHTHKTYHFEGSKKVLNQITKHVLGVSIKTVINALP